MKIFLHFTLLFLFQINLCAQEGHGQTSYPNNKKILILHSVEEARPWNALYNNSFRDAIKNNCDFEVEIIIEYLDLIRYNTDEYRDILEELIRHKYQNKLPDIIVVTQIEAVKFVTNRDLFPNTPKIFDELISDEPSNVDNSINITSVISFDSQLKHAFDIFPQTTDIYIIAGHSKIDKYNLEKFKKSTEHFIDTISFNYLIDLDTQTILDSISKLPDNSFVYYLSYTQKLNGKAIMAKDFSGELAQHSNRPVFGINELLTEGTGIFGGMIASIRSRAVKTVEVSNQVLYGEDITTIPPVNTNYLFAYDWNELKRWNIDIDKLPEESIFYNRTYTIWELHKKEVIIGVSLILSYTLLLILLLYFNTKKRISEKRLRRQNSQYELLTLKFKSKNDLLKIEKAKTEESEAKFRGLFDKVAEAIFAYNSNTFEILMANKATSEIYGYEEEDLIGMSCLHFNAMKDSQESIDNDPLFINIRHHKKKDGSDVFVELNGYTVHVNNQDIMFAVCKDITEKLRAEHALSRSEMKFRALFEQSGGYCMILDPNTTSGIPKVLDANDAACKKHGYSHEDFIGKSISDFIYEKEKALVHERTALIMTGKPYYGETVHVSKDKTLFNVAINAKRIDIEGEPPLIFATEYDITEKKKIEKELINAKEKAEESDRLKSAFLANMSHEIRTPMNGILGFTDLLKEPELSGEEHQQYIRIIEKSGERMLSTIENIINISRIESDQEELSITEVNLNKELVYLCKFFKPETLKKGLHLNFNFGLQDSESNILTDRDKLNSILTNLIKNAIKFTHQGSISIDYNILNINKKTELLFCVTDTGIGIPIDRQEAIFDRFVQADIEDTHVYEGSGLGLTISKAFTEMLGGKMWLESNDGSGTNFYFKVPFQQAIDEKSKDLKNEAKLTPTYSIPKFPAINILIAEDDSVSANYISVISKKIGNKILKARSGIETLELLRNNPDIDLILMDIQMPDLNGYEATREIRKHNKEILIFAQTAYAFAGDKEKAIEAGCNEYLTKPIDRIELLDLIDTYFRK